MIGFLIGELESITQVLSLLVRDQLGLSVALDQGTLLDGLERRVHLLRLQLQVEALPLLVDVDLGGDQELLAKVPFRIQSVLRTLPC